MERMWSRAHRATSPITWLGKQQSGRRLLSRRAFARTETRRCMWRRRSQRSILRYLQLHTTALPNLMIEENYMNADATRESKIHGEYLERTPRSARLHEQALELFPSGIVHDSRRTWPYGIYVDHAKGS